MKYCIKIILLFIIGYITFVDVANAQPQMTPIPRVEGPEGNWCALARSNQSEEQCGFASEQTACEQAMVNFYPQDTDILQNVKLSDSGGRATCDTDATTVRRRGRLWIGDPSADRRCLGGLSDSGGQCTPLPAQPTNSTPTCNITKNGGFGVGKGNPVDLLSGTKVEKVTDFVTADGRLKFSRAYASKSYGTLNNGTIGILGRGWSIDAFPRLTFRSTSTYTLFLPGHQAVSVFCPSGGCQVRSTAVVGGGGVPRVQFDDTDTEFSGQLSDQQDTIPFVDEGGMKYIFKSEQIDRDTYFTIRRIEYPGGYSIDYETRLINEPFSPIRFVVEKMTDSFGREITLEYGQEVWQDSDGNARQVPVEGTFGNFPVTTGLLERVTLPDQTVLNFSYDAVTGFGLRWGLSERLTSVERVSAVNNPNSPEILSREIYHYEAPNLPFALTGITDTAGVRYASWEYSDDGLAISSEHAGGVDRYEFDYDFVGVTLFPRATVTSTNPLGRDTIHRPDSFGVYFTGIDGQASSNCVADASRISNNPSRMILTDREGRVTRLEKDSKGWTTTKVEALGTPQEVVTTTQWHPIYKLPTRRERPGLIDERVYDIEGRLLSMTLTDTTAFAGPPRTWSYTYDGPNVTSIDGPLPGPSDTQFFTYNQERLTSITNEVGHLTRITAHNPIGAPMRIIDPNGVVTVLGYDSEHKLTSIQVDPTGRNAVTRLTYNAVDNVTSITSPNGTQISIIYDDARRVIGMRNNAGEAIDYVLNPMGGILKTEMSGEAGQIAYVMGQFLDERNRIIEMTKIGGQGGVSETNLAYDRESNLVGINDARNNDWENQFDNLDRLVKEIDPLGAQTDYELTAINDNRNPLSSVTDARDIATIYNRNGFGEVMEEISAERGTMTYERDERGLATSMTDARNVRVNYSYDAASRPLSEIYPDAPDARDDVVYIYDEGDFGVGELTSIIEGFGQTDYSFDALSHMRSKTRIINGQSYVTSYEYDNAGEMLRTIYPSGTIIDCIRDEIGRILSIELVDPQTGNRTPILSNATYKPFGPFESAQMGDGYRLSLGFDTAYRVKNLTRVRAGQDLMNIDFDHDDEGDIIAMTDHVRPERSQTFTYDPLSRMTSASGGYGQIDYSYNLVGDRLERNMTPLPSSSEPVSLETYIYEQQSAQLSQVLVNNTPIRAFDYAPSGQMVQDTQNRSALERAFTFDLNARGRMAAVRESGAVVANYTYDIYQQRVAKTITGETPIHYIYDTDGRLIAEADGASGEVLREYIWFGLTPIATLSMGEGGVSVEDCNPALIADLQSRLSARQARIELITERLVSIGTSVAERKARQAELDERRAAVQARLDTINPARVIRVDVLTARLAQIDERLANVEASLTRLTGRQADLEARLIELEDITLRLTARIERLEARCEVNGGQAAPAGAANDNEMVLNYLHADHLGRPAFATDTAGEIVWDGGITTPFGVQIETMGALTQNLMFPGQYEDEETGFYYNWHRTYDPTLGRYLQSDPIGLSGGLNRYAYVGGNPMNAIDFEGLRELGLRFGIGGAFLSGIQYGAEVSFDTRSKQFRFRHNYGGLIGFGGGFDLPIINRPSSCQEPGWSKEAIGELDFSLFGIANARKELSRVSTDVHGNVTRTGSKPWESNISIPGLERDKKGQPKIKRSPRITGVYSINAEHSYSSKGRCGCNQ